MASATGKLLGFLWIHVLAKKNLVSGFVFAARIAHVGPGGADRDLPPDRGHGQGDDWGSYCTNTGK